MDPLGAYIVARVLQIEGRLHDEDEGGWPIAVLRLFCGEGLPPPEACRPVELEKGKPLPEAQQFDRSVLRQNRLPFYQRIRNADDCARALQNDLSHGGHFLPGASASFEIGAEWYDPPAGIIDIPFPGLRPIDSHDVSIIDFDLSKKLFLLENSWGPWALNGYAFVSFAYFDERLIESWMRGIKSGLDFSELARGPGVQPIRWEAKGIYGELVQAIELYDTDLDERVAWAFLVVRNDAVHIEEFYVRPVFRHRGFGTRLAALVRESIRKLGRSVRLWVPFADCRAYSPDNYEPLKRLVGKLGLSFQKSPVKWAAYLAVSGVGSPDPVEPDHVPKRPKSALQAVKAAALAAGLLVGVSPRDGDAIPETASPTNGVSTQKNGSQSKPTTDELLEPFRRQVEESGITDDEIDELTEELREELSRERQGKPE